MGTDALTREKVLETTGVLALACLVVSLLAQRPGVRGDLLHLRRSTGPDRSYWVDRTHAYTRADLEKIW